MGFHKDMSVQSLDIESLNSILRKNRDGSFRPRGFEQIPADQPADAAFSEGLEPELAQQPAAEPEEEQISEAQAEQLAKAHKTGFTEGFAQGYQQGQAEAAQAQPDPASNDEALQQLEDAKNQFATLAQALVDQSEAHHTALRRSLERALLSMASELAGQQIDALPSGFADKIEDLVTRLGTTVECTSVHLNPDDLDAIQPHIAGNISFAECQFLPEDNLPRGAVDIRSGPNRVQSALPDLDADLPADWDDTELQFDADDLETDE